MTDEKLEQDFYSLTSLSPFYFQKEVAKKLLNKKNILLQAPTGTGKTWASILPFITAKLENIDFPHKMIYSLPMRVLANSLYNTVSKNNLSFSGTKKSQTKFIEKMLHLIEGFGKDAENRIKYKKFEFDDTAGTGKVSVQFIISNKKTKQVNHRKNILNLLFELEKNDNGFDIKGCTVI